MRLSIVWSKKAEKEWGRLDPTMRARIVAALDKLAETGQGDVKKLKGYVGEYRLRVGEWRVRFALDAARPELVVLHVLPRGGAYD